MSTYIFTQPYLSPLSGELYLFVPGAVPLTSTGLASTRDSLANYSGPPIVSLAMSVDDSFLMRELEKFPGDWGGGATVRAKSNIARAVGHPMSAKAVRGRSLFSKRPSSSLLPRKLTLYADMTLVNLEAENSNGSWISQGNYGWGSGDSTAPPDYLLFDCLPSKPCHYVAYPAGQGNFASSWW